MPRKSKVVRLPAEQRRFVEKLLRDDSLTLSEIFTRARAKFPDINTSRTGLGRYRQHLDELSGRMRDIQAAGTALVAELGEDPNDRAGQLLVNAVTTLATHAALQANDPDARDLNIKEIGMLARGARAVMETRKLSLAERQQIARTAKEQAAEEAGAAAREQGLSEETARKIRERILQGVA